MKGDNFRDGLPGVQWFPSNANAGRSFFEKECRYCARDRAMREGEDIEECDDNEKGEIIEASFAGQAVEWRELPNGQIRCMAFVKDGEPTPYRCDQTMDLFEQRKDHENQ